VKIKKIILSTFLVITGLLITLRANLTINRLIGLNANASTIRIYAFPENELGRPPGDPMRWDDKNIWMRNLDGGVWSSRVKMTIAVQDYFLGLLFADVAISSTKIQFFSNEISNNTFEQTEEIDLNEGNRFLGFKILNDFSGTGGRVKVSQQKLSMSAAEFSGVLYHIDSCSSSFSGGYNAYEQLIKLFVIDGETSIATAIVRRNYSTTTYFDMNYQQPFSTTTNRNLVVSVALKLNALRIASNASRGTTFIDIGGYREFVMGGTATPAGWTNNANTQKFNYNVENGVYYFSGIQLSTGDFRVITFNDWNEYNIGFSHIPNESMPIGFSNAGADNNIRVSASGVGVYNVQISFAGNSTPVLNFVKI
jgi:hypothetical protein